MGKISILIKTLAVGCVALMAGAAYAADEEVRAFRAIRKGDDIGYHKATITRLGDETRVQMDINLLVRVIGFLPVYRYTHQSEEVWRNGRLVKITSQTDDDGDKQYLNAEATPDGQLKVEGTKYKGLAPGSIMPTSYWNGEFTKRGSPLLDTQNGRLLDVQFTELETTPTDGVPPGSKRYKLDGDLKLEIWYDPRNRWTKTRFSASDNSVIDYKLQE
jgi:hypothetical protein